MIPKISYSHSNLTPVSYQILCVACVFKNMGCESRGINQLDIQAKHLICDFIKKIAT